MCKITEEVEAAYSPPCKDGVLLFSFVLPTHVPTPSPRCELCLWVRKTKERHLLLAPAWLQVRVKDHLSPWVLCKRLLWRGPKPAACIDPPPYSPSNAGFVPQGVAKAPGLHKAFPVWVPRHCCQRLGSQEATGTGALCKGRCCGGMGTTGCLHCTCIRESCTMPWGPARAAFLPYPLVWQRLFLMLFSLCLLLLQGRDGSHGENSALAAAAGTGLAGQHHGGAGLSSKQLQSQGELRQDQGKSSFPPGSVMSCLTSLPMLQNLTFNSTSVFTFSFSHRQQYWETAEVCDVARTSTDAGSWCIW